MGCFRKKNKYTGDYSNFRTEPLESNRDRTKSILDTNNNNNYYLTQTRFFRINPEEVNSSHAKQKLKAMNSARNKENNIKKYYYNKTTENFNKTSNNNFFYNSSYNSKNSEIKLISKNNLNRYRTESNFIGHKKNVNYFLKNSTKNQIKYEESKKNNEKKAYSIAESRNYKYSTPLMDKLL